MSNVINAPRLIRQPQSARYKGIWHPPIKTTYSVSCYNMELSHPASFIAHFRFACKDTKKTSYLQIFL